MVEKITGIGAVVRDLEITMTRLWLFFGMGPWEVCENCGYRSATFQTKKIEFELIQPTRQDNIYASFLKNRGEGLCHIYISFDSENTAEHYKKGLQDKGVHVVGDFAEVDSGRRICLNTWNELGFGLELRTGKRSPGSLYNPKCTGSPNFPVRHYIRQMGIVVTDTEKTIRCYQRYLNLDGWKTVSFNNRNLEDFKINEKKYDGEFEFLCSVRWVGEVEFELVEPRSGPLIYTDYLKYKGPGFHHIKSVMSDIEIRQLMGHLAQYEIHDIQSGRLNDNHHFNLNTEPLVGFTLELGNGGKSIALS